MPVRYTAEAKIMVTGKTMSATALSGTLSQLGGALSGSLPGLKNPMDQWVGVLKSRSIADRVIDQFGLMKEYQEDFRFKAREILADRTTVLAEKDGSITIKFEDTSPVRAAEVVNRYVLELQHTADRLANEAAQQQTSVFEIQLASALKRLDAAQLKLEKAGINPNLLGKRPEVVISRVAMLDAEIAARQVKAETLRRVVTEDNSILKATLSELRALQAQRRALGDAVENAPKPSGGDTYATAVREFTFASTLVEVLAKQFEMSKASETMGNISIQVIDSATVPEWKSSPKRALISFLAAILALLAIIILMIVQFVSRAELERDPRKRQQLDNLRKSFK
jgi:uncharacterized protein involved in exopolysaccharide biosynthesis